jgi:predicted pyridoxine 5'-phosphate oxidase superfamily flavin-nucleotide-binding protein
MQVSPEIMETVNKPGRVGTLSTADQNARPNVAYFGSPRFLDQETFVAALTANRTLANLEENPYAVFFCVEEAPVSFGTSGCRLYLKVKEIQKHGPLLDQMKATIAQNAGEKAAEAIRAAVAFDVTDTRPLVDMG